MNENLNLLEILKDCHKGTKFYSRFLGSVEFCNITSDNYIEVMDKNECHIEFKPNGTYKHSEENAEIDLFPSKDQKDWSKWHSPFVKGDILVSEKGNIVLCSHIDEEQVVHYHCILNFWGNLEIHNGTGVGYSYNCNLANDSQKQRLFDALKKEGYEWDDITKTLEKLITSKFKDEDEIHLWTIQDAKEGDVLAINWYEGCDYWEKIVIFKKYHNEGANSPCVEGYGNTFKNRKLAFQEEVPRFSKTWTSCLEPANKEQRDLLFQTIKEAGYKWNADEKKLEKLIEPKFKVGDKIKRIKNSNIYEIIEIRLNCYIAKHLGSDITIGFDMQDEYELVPDEIKPKFKVGDKIKCIENGNIYEIIGIRSNCYTIKYPGFDITIGFDMQDEYELVHTPKFKDRDKIKEKNEIFPSTQIIMSYNDSIHDWVRIEEQDDWELLVITPKFKVGDRIRKKGDYICGIIKCIDIDNFYKVEYSSGGVSFVNVKYQNDYELVPNKFNPKSLQPFDKVLVKDSIGISWHIQFFEAIHEWDKNFPVKCVGGKGYSFCIPYNDDTKHLIGKSDEAPEFYRYWEE